MYKFVLSFNSFWFLFLMLCSCGHWSNKEREYLESSSSSRALKASSEEVPFIWSHDSLQIKEKCKAAARQLEQQITALVQVKAPIFANIHHLDKALAVYTDQVNYLGFYGYVSDKPKLKDAGLLCIQETNKTLLDIFSREDLYALVNKVKNSAANLDPVENELINHYLEEFQNNGMSLKENQRFAMRKLQQSLFELETEFEKNLSGSDVSLSFSEMQLIGVPENFLKSLERDQSNHYIVTLKYPHYSAVQEFVKDPFVRQEMYQAFNNRGGAKNSEIIKKSLIIRAKIASLLGFEYHAQKVLSQRMARSPEVVRGFLNELGGVVKKRNHSDLLKLLDEKRYDLNDQTIEVLYPWDVAYYSRIIKVRDYHVDQEIIKQYFPLEYVLKGMFAIYEELFAIKFIASTQTPVWHESVRFFDIEDEKTGEKISGFFMDLFPRYGKYNHAAAFPLLSGFEKDNGTYSKPFSAIVANFSAPTKSGLPSLLKHDEVVTLFHEFGHIMHQTLTKVKFGSLSGTSVKKDFVEAPSQMLEHWVWELDVLRKISSHYKHNEPLPEETLRKMLDARYFNMGYRYARQLFFANIDMEYHSLKQEELHSADTTSMYHNLFENMLGLPASRDTHPEAAFGHLMGGYDAGYYGYLWSEVFAADMFSKFKEEGLFSKDLGNKYRACILEKGGSKRPDALIEEFLDRKSKQDAFLEKFEF